MLTSLQNYVAWMQRSRTKDRCAWLATLIALRYIKATDLTLMWLIFKLRHSLVQLNESLEVLNRGLNGRTILVRQIKRQIRRWQV